MFARIAFLLIAVFFIRAGLSPSAQAMNSVN
jgi:hypothetical protein